VYRGYFEGADNGYIEGVYKGYIEGAYKGYIEGVILPVSHSNLPVASASPLTPVSMETVAASASLCCSVLGGAQ
ncbi:hypothetical protein NDU88_000488, partial [Pleurodeles waltl]